MLINKIQELTIEDARNLAIETMVVKDHECFFVDFKDRFGYSVLVFKNDKHIYYANDYELHHGHLVREKGIDALKEFYINSLNGKLYTDEEMLKEATSFDEYTKKSYFLRNYYIMRYEHCSIFGIGEEEQARIKKAMRKLPFYNPISFCYVKDEEIIRTQMTYLAVLEKGYENLKNNQTAFREMVSYELANHEACITCRYQEALDALGMKFVELTEDQQRIVKDELQKQIDTYLG